MLRAVIVILISDGIGAFGMKHPQAARIATVDSLPLGQYTHIVIVAQGEHMFKSH